MIERNPNYFSDQAVSNGMLGSEAIKFDQLIGKKIVSVEALDCEFDSEEDSNLEPLAEDGLLDLVVNVLDTALEETNEGKILALSFGSWKLMLEAPTLKLSNPLPKLPSSLDLTSFCLLGDLRLAQVRGFSYLNEHLTLDLEQRGNLIRLESSEWSINGFEEEDLVE